MLGKPVLQFESPRMPTLWWFLPVSSAARVGEHSGVTWKFVKRSPPAASSSMFGVTRSDPKQLKCEKPRSSMRITTMFGAFSLGCVGVGHHGTDSATVSPIVPSKRSNCFNAPPSNIAHATSPPADVTATPRSWR
jgi:hypothetical protein